MCQKRTVFRNYWLTVSTTARGAGPGERYFAVIQQEIARFGTLWPQSVFPFFFFFKSVLINLKDAWCQWTRDSTPSVEVGQATACLLTVRGYQDLKAADCQHWMALGAMNGSLCCLAGLGLQTLLDPSTRTMNALMSWISSPTFQPVLLEDTHTLRNNILISSFCSLQIWICSINRVDHNKEKKSRKPIPGSTSG